MDNYYTSTLVSSPLLLPAEQAVEQVLAQRPNLSHLHPHHPQVTWLGQDKPTKIAEVRATQFDLQHHGLSDGLRVVIFNQVDRMSIPAQNALLKLVEEPPAQVQILLLTNDPGAVLPTIASRCQLLTLTANTVDTSLPNIKEVSQHTPAQLIELATQFSDSDQAANLIFTWIHQAHHQLTQNPTNQILHHQLRQLQTTHQDLKTNANTKLVLEHCFFQLFAE